MKNFFRIFLHLNQVFLADLYQMNTYNEAVVLTILPSAIFLLSNFIIMYHFCHRYTFFGIAPYQAWFLREMTFHCTYFYFSKVWLIFLQAYKVSFHRTCEYLDGCEWAISKQTCNFIGLIVLSVLAVSPLMAYTIRKSNSIKNVYRIEEDPWIQSEIGISGHYLIRPPPFQPHVNVTSQSYRMRRSSSTPCRKRNRGFDLRAYKSLGYLEDKKCNMY